MNFSDLKPQIYNYLGFRGVVPSPETEELIDSCLPELDNVQQFNYLCRSFDTPPEFLAKPPYDGFLRGCRGVILSVMTLGAGVDRLINRLSRVDMARSVVMDACASAYLEARSDEYERSLGDDLTYRFCPGYGGSSVEDIRYIFELLKPEKIGITLTDSCFILPTKSMAGIIGVGKNVKKSCESCFMFENCSYRKEGRRCFAPEKR